MKTPKEYFRDWHSGIFGFGYGTGEQYILPALRRFMELTVPNESGNNPSCYDYNVLEKELIPPVAWLLINLLCKDDMIEYGTSPRYGWLTDKGNILKAYVLSCTNDQLYEAATLFDESYIHCSQDYCNCDDNSNKKCKNPFF